MTVATNVSVTGSGVAQFAVAENGNVAYIPQEPASLVFVDRNGASRLVTPERRNFHHPLFSPDGRRLSLDFNSVEGRNVWILDLGEGTLSRATFDRDGHDATWTPDGRFLTYIVPVNRPGSVLLQLLRKRPGSAEAPDTLLTSPLLAYTGVWLKDGSAMVTTAADLRRDPKLPDSTQGGAGTDAAIIRNAGKGPLEPLVASRFNESFVGRVARRPLDLVRVGPVGAGRGVRPRPRRASGTRCWSRPTAGTSRCGVRTGGSCSIGRRSRKVPTWSRPASRRRRRSP